MTPARSNVTGNATGDLIRTRNTEVDVRANPVSLSGTNPGDFRQIVNFALQGEEEWTGCA